MAKQEQLFRTRTLNDPSKVFEHNAWDDVEWDEEQETEARKKVKDNSQLVVQGQMQEYLESNAYEYWDKFYTIHQNRFFKDRHWLFHEFPELLYNPSSNSTTSDTNSSHENSENVTDLQNSSASGSSESNSVKDSSKTSETTENIMQDLSTRTDDSVSKNSEFESNAVSENTESKAKSLVETSEKETVDDSSSPLVNKSQEQPDIKEIGGYNSRFPGDHSAFRILEVGCGVGNTIFPVLQTNNDPGVFVYGCDLSSTAIDLVKEHHLYDKRRCHGFVFDVTNEADEFPFPENSLDLVICIFVISAIHPEKFQATFDRFARCLKPGGRILFRDYGRYDLAQLRFKNGQCLSENFYARQDGTRVYFFTQDELREMLTKAGLVEEQNIIDRRLQVNRRTQQKLYRVWIQCKYRRPLS